MKFVELHKFMQSENNCRVNKELWNDEKKQTINVKIVIVGE